MHRKLRNHREACRLSQAAMGKILGISQTQYHRKETDLSPFTREEGEKIASYFSIPLEELLDFSNILQDHHLKHGSMAKTIDYIADILTAEVIEMNYFLKKELLDKTNVNNELREKIQDLEEKLKKVQKNNY